MAFEGKEGHGLIMYLDRHSLLSSDLVLEDELEEGAGAETFHVAIGNLLDSPDVKSGRTKIRMGYHTEIQVRPQSVQQFRATKKSALFSGVGGGPNGF